VFSGVTERFPNIQFCLAHGGGTTASITGRLIRGQSTGRLAVPASVDIGRAMRRFCVDCITHDAAALELAAGVHGADNLVFGSDWPFPMGVLDPARQLAGVPRSLLDKMFDDNPACIIRRFKR
jgi:aminocarboxymuconate-semialdehyde decarboxylase